MNGDFFLLVAVGFSLFSLPFKQIALLGIFMAIVIPVDIALFHATYTNIYLVIMGFYTRVLYEVMKFISDFGNPTEEEINKVEQ